MSEMRERPPIVNIVGRSDSGKTGVMVAVVSALAGRGWRVATVKHHHRGELDTPGKDSWRHARAGAVSTALIGESQYAVFTKTEGEPDFETVVDALSDADIVLVEGFKSTGYPRIEVVRSERSEEPVTDPASLLAMVTDVPALAAGMTETFGFDELEALAEKIEREFISSGA